jgi:hypothetical protein
MKKIYLGTVSRADRTASYSAKRASLQRKIGISEAGYGCISSLTRDLPLKP